MPGGGDSARSDASGKEGKRWFRLSKSQTVYKVAMEFGKDEGCKYPIKSDAAASIPRKGVGRTTWEPELAKYKKTTPRCLRLACVSQSQGRRASRGQGAREETCFEFPQIPKCGWTNRKTEAFPRCLFISGPRSRPPSPAPPQSGPSAICQGRGAPSPPRTPAGSRQQAAGADSCVELPPAFTLH